MAPVDETPGPFFFARQLGTDETFSGFVRLWYFLLVTRFARVIALGTPHRVTQKGRGPQNRRSALPARPAGRRRQTYGWIRDFGSNLGQPGIGGTISRRVPCQPRPMPFARAPIPDGRSAHRNLSRIYPKTGTRLRPPPLCSERRSREAVGAQSCRRLTAIKSQFLVETSRLSPVFGLC